MTTTDDGPPAAATVVLAEPSRRGRRHAGQHSATKGKDGRRHRRLLLWVLLAVGVLVVGGVTWVAVTRIDTPLARPVARPGVTAAIVVPGPSPLLPWPTKGQGAVAVPAIRFSAQSGPESPVPVASLTKMTTAVVILRDHPLPAGSDGPLIALTPGDVAEYEAELKNDESSVAIEVGESLTERQMLQALLTQSANDIAYSLAVWDAGSVPAFVVKMNALAASLGMTDTHYVDASGYEPATVSSASDVLRVAAVGMATPAFAQTVALTSVTLPLVGTLKNIVTEVGTDGVVGIKSGYTSAAGACMVLAAERTVRDRQVLVLVAVLGQPTPPPTQPKPSTSTTTTAPTAAHPPAPPAAGSTTPTAPAPPTSTTTTTTIPRDDLPIADPFKYARPTTDSLLASTAAAVTPVTVATADQVVGTVSATWGGRVHRVSYVTTADEWLLGWPGQQVATATQFTAIAPGSRAGTGIGTALYAIGSQFRAVPLALAETVPEPSVWWRLAHA